MSKTCEECGRSHIPSENVQVELSPDSDTLTVRRADGVTELHELPPGLAQALLMFIDRAYSMCVEQPEEIYEMPLSVAYLALLTGDKYTQSPVELPVAASELN